MNLDFLDYEGAEVRKMGPLMPQNVNSNIDIVSVERSGDKTKIRFLYTATFFPDGSYIRMAGRADFSGPEAKLAYESWVSNKKLGGMEAEQIVNTLNYTSSMNAVIVARAFNMPPPVVLPTIKFESPAKVVAKRRK